MLIRVHTVNRAVCPASDLPPVTRLPRVLPRGVSESRYTAAPLKIHAVTQQKRGNMSGQEAQLDGRGKLVNHRVMVEKTNSSTNNRQYGLEDDTFTLLKLLNWLDNYEKHKSIPIHFQIPSRDLLILKKKGSAKTVDYFSLVVGRFCSFGLWLFLKTNWFQLDYIT